MVHLDSHPDLLIPVQMCADTVYNKEELFRCGFSPAWNQSACPLSVLAHINSKNNPPQKKNNLPVDAHLSQLMGAGQQVEDEKISKRHKVTADTIPLYYSSFTFSEC